MIKQLLISIITSWLVVKIIKTIIIWAKEKKISFKTLFYDGGMPSSHTVLVASAATAIYLETGFSPLFILSVIITLIVMNDAMKVRWVTEEQSRAINKLTEGKQGFRKMDEHVGHKPMEVLVGLIIGIIIPIIVYAVI
ncbi:divergent PAP2 family protein [Candidatus Woesearchaeota archaeon]|nr:divergent PAP2 family protein [Candidatus Woesearchaeota archaeon]